MNFSKLFFKKLLRYLLKPLSFVPALCMMYIIYSFSAQDGTSSGHLSVTVSHYLVLAYNKIAGKHYSNEMLELLIIQIHPYVRKMAHVTEYFILAMTIALPLYVYRIRGIWLILLGMIFCVAFAGLDEYHQSFVAGRGPSIRDVKIDSAGSFAGLLVAQIICFIGRKTVFRGLSLEHYRQLKKNYEAENR